MRIRLLLPCFVLIGCLPSSEDPSSTASEAGIDSGVDGGPADTTVADTGAEATSDAGNTSGPAETTIADGGCDPCPDGVPCVEGECACPEGQTLCGDACVDTSSNAAHCGGCDAPCEMFCLLGECATDCGTLQVCGDACVDTTSDAQHCGECNLACDSGKICSESACVCTADPVSFSETIAPLLVAECTAAGCHGGPMPQSGLDLRAESSYAELVNVPADQCGGRIRVVPGDVANSYLVNKLLGVDMCLGSQMPKAGQSLPAADLDAIEAWICHGALE